MTPGRLKHSPAGERDSFESRRVANRYSERIGRLLEIGLDLTPSVMYLNGLCPSAFARRHYDARAMDTVQMNTPTPRGLHTENGEGIHGLPDSRNVYARLPGLK